MSKRLKILIAILAVFGLIFVYAYFSPDEGGDIVTAPKINQAGIPANTSLEGGEILNMLANLESIELDASFFKNEIFQGLVDFSVELTPEEAGRLNPFAPLE